MDAEQGRFFFDTARLTSPQRCPLVSFISMAARFGDVDTLRKLLQEAMAHDTGFLSSPTVGMAIKRATQAGQVDVLRCLVETGIDINTKFKGASALHEAVKVNKLDVLDFLLGVPGIQTGTLSVAQKTPVMEAACRGQFLEEHRAAATLLQWTQFWAEALSSWTQVQCLTALLAAGCPPDTRNARGLTALHYCLLPSIGTLDCDDMNACLNLLYAAGADINAQDRYGSTPLHVAIATENLEAVLWLLRHNCCLETEAQPPDLALGVFSRLKRSVAMTPLLLATHFSNRRLVELLVSCGARCERMAWTLLYCQPYRRLHDFLEQCVATPVSLHVACRRVVRQSLNNDVDAKVAQLTCLPMSVQRFILLSDELQQA